MMMMRWDKGTRDVKTLLESSKYYSSTWMILECLPVIGTQTSTWHPKTNQFTSLRGTASELTWGLSWGYLGWIGQINGIHMSMSMSSGKTSSFWKSQILTFFFYENGHISGTVRPTSMWIIKLRKCLSSMHFIHIVMSFFWIKCHSWAPI